jgi:hypothetical protein
MTPLVIRATMLWIARDFLALAAFFNSAMDRIIAAITGAFIPSAS